jgi:integrating conjugative element relaxase (TIGR03760 family)
MALNYTDLALIGLLGVSGAAYFWSKSSKKTAKTAHKAVAAPAHTNRAAAFNLLAAHGDKSRPANQLPILTAQALWDSTSCRGQIEKIRSILSLTSENWSRDVLPLLERYSEFVQLLPASESHHHSQPGGLLEHTLDVATLALTIRQAYKLPPGVPVEDQMRLASVGSYAVLIAALLHDVGKPVCDVAIHLYGRIPERSLDRWNGLGGSMSSLQSSLGATHYTVEFEGLASGYEAHQRLPLTLLHALVPASGLAWLAKAPSLFSELTAYLSAEADEKSILKEIVTKADSASVAENLKNGNRARFASAKTAPLIERLMHSLHNLAVEGAFAINRPGAPMFIDPAGDYVWIVAGKAADMTREHITQAAKQQGLKPSIPNDNTRLFDTWQEYGFCESPPAAYGKGSVWWVRIDVDGWSQVLTMLKFPVSAVFKDAPAPDNFMGSITPVDPATPRKSALTKQLEQDENTQVGTLEQPAGDSEQEIAQDSNTAPNSALLPQSVQPLDLLEQPTSLLVEDQTIAEPDPDSGPAPDPYLQATIETGAAHKDRQSPELTDANKSMAGAALNSADSAMNFDEENHKTDPNKVPDLVLMPSPKTMADIVDDGFLDESDGISVGKTYIAPTSPVQMAKHDAQLRRPAMTARRLPPTPRLNADRFIAWLQNGLGTGAIIHNESSAFIHFVPDGMAILSPLSFKLFLEQNAFVGELPVNANSSPSKDEQAEKNLSPEKKAALIKKKELAALQRELQKSGYIAFNKPENTFFHRYQTKSAEGETGAIITCYLVANPLAYISPVPSANKLLVKVVPSTVSEPITP